MNTTNCGCAPTPETSRKMLLVEATPSEQNLCGELKPINGTENCPLQEQTFDIILSSFVLPSTSGSIGITVCNASVYSVNQWIQFINPVATLKIIAINENTITLVNRCDTGDTIPSNPEAGLVIQKNAVFCVSPRPSCDSYDEWVERVTGVISGLEAICAENMVESTNLTIIQPVGQVITNPNASSEKKCIKKIFGFLFKAGTPFFTAIKKTTSEAKNSYRRLGISKTTREVQELPNYSENSLLVADKQYSIAYDNEKEYPVGPCMFPSLFKQGVKRVGSIVSLTPTFVAINDIDYSTTIDLSGNTNINDRLKKDQDYYAILHLIVAHIQTDNNILIQVKINGFIAGYISSNFEGAGLPLFQITLPVKIDKDDKEIKIELKGISNIISIALEATLLGAYF